MPRIPLLILSLILGAACAVLVSCGSGTNKEKLLPPEAADAMIDNLEQAQRLAERGDCDSAAGEATNLLEQVDKLGPEVDPDLKNALEDGFRHLQGLAESDACSVVTTETTPTTETTETTTATVTTTPTVTQTTTPTTPPTQTTPPTTTPSDGGGGTGGDDEGGGTGAE